MYPVVEIKLDNIIENAKKVNEECKKNNIKLSVVTKVLSDNKNIVKALCDNGIECISDSRIESLKHYKDIHVEKWLIRSPMFCEIEDVVKYASASLNSEMTVIRALSKEAKKQGKKHKVILMYELGDLREGMNKDELFDSICEILKLDNIILYGIGVNLSCYGEILPSNENMKELSDLAKEIENKFNIKLEVISGGNSTSYPMMMEGKLPENINSLRLGEAVFLGNVPCINKLIDGLNHNNFVLKTQIIELKEKPSIPWGKSGNYNAFGEKALYVDRGIRKRAIIALGKQDVNINGLTPVDNKLIVLGGSSDHIIVDVTDSKKTYKVGDIIEFNLDYSGILTLMTSKYVNRVVDKAKKVDYIAACSDLGVIVDGADLGPIEVLNNIDKNKVNNVSIIEKGNVIKEKEPGNKKRNLNVVNEFNERLYNAVYNSVNKGNIPLTVGGDHSIAIASALASIKKYEDLGVIWFDSHADYNTFDTTITGNIHGLPLAVITGYEKRLLCDYHNGNFYNPKNTVIVGARDLDDLEYVNLKDAGVTVFTTKDIQKYGAKNITEEAFKIANLNTNGVHASIDIDLIDPLVAPGVSVKAKDGINEKEFYQILEIILKHMKNIKSEDVVEYNPMQDKNNVTKKLTLNVVNKLIDEKNKL